MYFIEEFQETYNADMIQFLQECLPQSGRKLELDGRHKMYQDIKHYFQYFWCMFAGEKIIGTVALKRLQDKECELKSLYLLEEYHGRGLGDMLLQKAISQAKTDGYRIMRLDTLSSSKRAISLYKKAGFTETERYNENNVADVFMKLFL